MQGMLVKSNNERGEELWAIIREAVINTRSRPITRRGPWIISDEYLDNCIKELDKVV